MKKAGKYALAAGLLVAFFLIPYEVHKHSSPEKSFAAVGDLPAPLSPYDSLIRMYADSIGWDWRLVAAVIRQESHFNKNDRKVIKLMEKHTFLNSQVQNQQPLKTNKI